MQEQLQFIKGAKTPTRLGNYVKAENLFGFPDFGNESGAQALVPYARCQLFEDTLTGGILVQMIILVSQEYVM